MGGAFETSARLPDHPQIQQTTRKGKSKTVAVEGRKRVEKRNETIGQTITIDILRVEGGSKQPANPSWTRGFVNVLAISKVHVLNG